MEENSSAFGILHICADTPESVQNNSNYLVSKAPRYDTILISRFLTSYPSQPPQTEDAKPSPNCTIRLFIINHQVDQIQLLIFVFC